MVVSYFVKALLRGCLNGRKKYATVFSIWECVRMISFDGCTAGITQLRLLINMWVQVYRKRLILQAHMQKRTRTWYLWHMWKKHKKAPSVPGGREGGAVCIGLRSLRRCVCAHVRIRTFSRFREWTDGDRAIHRGQGLPSVWRCRSWSIALTFGKATLHRQGWDMHWSLLQYIGSREIPVVYQNPLPACTGVGTPSLQWKYRE